MRTNNSGRSNAWNFRLRAVLLTLCTATPFAASAQTQTGGAERIFVNGNIWTGDAAKPAAEALAVAGDKILAVGSSQQIRALAGPKTSTVDLGGRLVVPGMQDSHLHLPGPSINSVKLNGVESLQEFQQRLTDFVKTHPKVKWVTGRGWGYSAFPNGEVHRKYLDAVVADRPVYVIERDSHMGIANTKALEMAGVTKGTKDPPNGHIMRDMNGELTGEFKEAAQHLITDHIPARTSQDIYESFLAHMDEAASKGITAMQNAIWTPEQEPTFERALKANVLKQRIYQAPIVIPGEGTYPKDHHMKRALNVADLAEYKRLRDEKWQGPYIKFGGIKLVLDGVVDGKTALMFEPYVDTHGDAAGDHAAGTQFWEADELDRTIALYDKEGFQMLLHGIGDKAVNMLLNAVEKAQKANGTGHLRHRIEHAEITALSDIPRFKQLGVIASTQALFAMPDATVLTNYAVVIGPKRAAIANAFKLFDDAGVVQAFGSDWSVFDNSPLWGIHVAVTRTTPEGKPPGGWYPQNRISVEAALRHYTIDGAYANFEEKIRGTLMPGKYADFVVLSKDIFKIPPADIIKTKPLLTVMGGKDTYRDETFE
jgi:predicted amidohydrolase YtcJ